MAHWLHLTASYSHKISVKLFNSGCKISKIDMKSVMNSSFVEPGIFFIQHSDIGNVNKWLLLTNIWQIINFTITSGTLVALDRII